MKRVGNILLGLWPLPVIAVALRLSDNGIWVTFVVYHILCLLIARRSPREARLVTGNWRAWLPASVLASIPLFLLMHTVILEAWKRGMVTTDGLSALQTSGPWTGFVLYILAFNPLIEEYYWRGYHQERVGLLFSAALFALIHYPLYSLLFGPLPGLLGCFSPFLLGLLWGWLLARYSSLWPAVITHIAVNAGMMLAATQVLSGHAPTP